MSDLHAAVETATMDESTVIMTEAIEQAFARQIRAIIAEPARADPEQREFAELMEQAVRASREQNIEGVLMLAARMMTSAFATRVKRDVPLSTHLAFLLNTVGRLEVDV